MQALVFVVASSAIGVFLACGSPALTESETCARPVSQGGRGGSCVDTATSCNPEYVVYLDSCFCCAPPEDAGTPVTSVADTGTGTTSTGDDDATTGGDASEDDASEPTDADMATDATDAAVSPIQDARADG